MINLLLFVCLAISSCGHLKPIGIGIGECALDALPSAIAKLIPEVEQIMQSGDNSSIQGSLESLGAKYGVGLVVCAVQKVLAGIFAQKGIASPKMLANIHQAEKWLALQNGAAK